MPTIDLQNVRDELCNKLRGADIFTTTVRGVTTTTDNFVATSAQTAFQLANTLVRNVRSVTVASVAKTYITDFTFNETTGVLTLTTGATVSDAVAVQYDYSSTGSDRIYPDMPRVDLGLTSYPRVGIQITSITTTPLGLGGSAHVSDILLTVYAFVPANKDSAIANSAGGTEYLTDLITSIRTAVRSGAKAFGSFRYITPATVSPVIAGTDNKVLQQSIDFRIPYVIE